MHLVVLGLSDGALDDILSAFQTVLMHLVVLGLSDLQEAASGP